jgi:hypothetical protein
MFGEPPEGLVEAIARRWFERTPASQPTDWDKQPAHLQEQYRERARMFWREPGRMERLLHEISCYARQTTSLVERATIHALRKVDG